MNPASGIPFAFINGGRLMGGVGTGGLVIGGLIMGPPIPIPRGGVLPAIGGTPKLLVFVTPIRFLCLRLSAMSLPPFLLFFVWQSFFWRACKIMQGGSAHLEDRFIPLIDLFWVMESKTSKSSKGNTFSGQLFSPL
jgi:hypothetical protein